MALPAPRWHICAALLPGLTTIVKLVRHHRLDRLGTLVIAMMLLGVSVSLITGRPQFLLAKEGWITGLWGAWFLISLRSRRPLAFTFSRQLVEGRRTPGPRAAGRLAAPGGAPGSGASAYRADAGTASSAPMVWA
jgi:membrane associated rhomboid family serine protease